MLALSREGLYEVFEDIQPLLRDHYAELAKNQDRIALKPDWSRYALLEANNSMRVFTARKDGRLVGYSVFFVAPHPHYADMLLANNDILFLSAAHRSGRTGIHLLEFCEKELAAEFAGSQMCIAWHAKPETALERILKRRAYQVQDVVFARLISPSTPEPGAP